jgi:hypothetical protein
MADEDPGADLPQGDPEPRPDWRRFNRIPDGSVAEYYRRREQVLGRRCRCCDDA